MIGDEKPYKIIGAYDSETTNYDDAGKKIAFPILHQLGILKNISIEDVTADNVEFVTDIKMYRHSLELYNALDELVDLQLDYVPVIMCHNLAFDMYGLAPWLKRHDVKVLAKSERKPITLSILDDSGKPCLVIWDTLIFTQQGLERMGNDCGYKKGVGEWDYSLIRTPETELTALEIDYAKRDIYTLLAWFGWWLRRNPDISPDKLGLNVVTKTGIVRERRRVRFSDLKGEGRKSKVGRDWLRICAMEAPQSDDELYTMMASTRGGFTFCSSENASLPFDLVKSDYIVAGYDATSQHPAQLVSHLYPVQFKERPTYVLEQCFKCVQAITMEHILDNWSKPFPIAFYGCFEFENLRPKEGSIFKDCGVLPLASARYKTKEQLQFDEDNGDKQNYLDEMHRRDYADSAINPTCAFGKLVSADSARIYLTELTAWEICQCYDFDSVKAIHGYSTGKFVKPCDMDVLSVMQFYKAKNEFKEARETFFKEKTIYNSQSLLDLGIAPAIVEGMENGTISDGDVNATYMGLKADLNAIFGISCSNQYRRQTVLTDTGITYTGDFGIVNAPKCPKVWYQFGQRIVGWSRIAQIIAIELSMKHALTLINGDTDSIKVLTTEDELCALNNELKRLANAIDDGKSKVCIRVQGSFPTYYDPLEEIGYYVHEFSTKRFCASWNKAYCIHSYDKRERRYRFDFTLAGIPTKRRVTDHMSFIGINGLADRLFGLGWSFSDICNVFLGYNVTFAYDIIRLNGRTFPEWSEQVFLKVRDYLGDVSLVSEPCALALFPMSKTINDTDTSTENKTNMFYALRNNPDVNTSRKLVFDGGIMGLDLKGVFNNV